MAPKSLRKTYLGYKIGKRLGEGLHLKGAKKEFTMKKFPQANALRFSQAEGELEDCLGHNKNIFHNGFHYKQFFCLRKHEPLKDKKSWLAYIKPSAWLIEIPRNC